MLRLAHIFLCFYLLYFMFVFNKDKDVFVDCDIPSGFHLPRPLPSSLPPCPIDSEWNRQTLSLSNYLKGQNLNSKTYDIKINCYDALQIFVLSLGVFTLLTFGLLHLCTHVCYVAFNTNLNLYMKKKT